MKLLKNQIKQIIKEEIKSVIDEMYYDSLKDVKNYKDTDELIGQRVWTHTNRSHRSQGRNGMIGIYGTTKNGIRTGSPLNYTNCIRLGDPIVFQVSSGTERIAATGTRTLVAGVSGTVIETKEGQELNGFIPFGFSPFVEPKYFNVDGKKLITAEEVYFHASEDGKYTSLVKGPVFESESENQHFYLPFEQEDMKNITKLSPKQKRKHNRKTKPTPDKIQMPLNFGD